MMCVLSYHQKVIEQEDLSLVETQLLRFIRVRHFEQPAVTYQPAMW